MKNFSKTNELIASGQKAVIVFTRGEKFTYDS